MTPQGMSGSLPGLTVKRSAWAPAQGREAGSLLPQPARPPCVEFRGGSGGCGSGSVRRCPVLPVIPRPVPFIGESGRSVIELLKN